MTFDEWFDEQVKRTGFSDPWQNSYDSAKDAWHAAKRLQFVGLDLTMLREARRLQDEDSEFPGACGAYEEFLEQILK